MADERTWLAKIDSLLAYVSTIWTDPIIITGDTNIDLLEINSDIVVEYNSVLQNHSLKQHTTKATRLIISLQTSAMNYKNVLPCGAISDNDGPYVIFNVKTPPLNQDTNAFASKSLHAMHFSEK